ncbi:MAG: toprim domain-containing protein [Persephonella sp.]|nr:toprim domain-containing protein [Persephonella sp.]
MKDETLKEWIKRLKDFSKSDGIVVIVEGKRDRDKLKKAGVEHIYSIRGRRFYDILEELENSRKVVILTDLDRQGEKICKKLSHMFQKEGIPVDTAFRESLKKFEIKHIEEIPV